ncbi:MAG: tetratricopeptide repeat protein [Hyphomicrobiales bacterium]|nr:tetratricopeptide repeat protein [Hyphomicrobiales bacterium]
MTFARHTHARHAHGWPTALALVVLAVCTAPPAAAQTLGDCRSTNENYKARIAACTRLIESRKLRGPSLAQAYMHRASAYDRERQYDRAIADFTEAARHDPTNDNPWFYRALIFFFNKQDYQQAIADLTEALARKKDYVNYGMRGRAYERIGDLERALADFQESLRLNPSYESALEGLDRVTKLLAARATPPAAPAGPAAPAAPQAPVAVVSEADRNGCQDAKAQPAQAIPACDRLITAAAALSPGELAIIHLWRGMHRSLASDHDAALADYDAALRIDPKLASAYLYRATLLEFHGHLERALADFRMAFALDPAMTDAAEGVRRVEAKLKSAR